MANSTKKQIQCHGTLGTRMRFPWNIFQVKYKTSTFIGFWFIFYFFWLLYVYHEHMEASQSFWILQYGFESVVTEGRQANPTEV